MFSSLLTALRRFRTRLPLVTRQAAQARWAHCASWTEARALMHRLLPWHRADAWADLVTGVPTCWPDLVPTAVARGPTVTRALLHRSDCTAAIAQRLVHQLPRHPQFGDVWGPEAIFDVLTEFGARGWSVVTLDAPRWLAIMEAILPPPIDGTYPSSSYAHVTAWQLLLSTPDVPAADWAAALDLPTSPGYSIAPTLFRRLLMDRRLSAVDRRRLVSNSLFMSYDGEIPFIFWDSLAWQLPGALSGMLDVEGSPAAGAPVSTRFLDALWLAVAGRPPAQRAAFWEALAAADSPGRSTVVDALWDAHRDALLAMDDAMAPLLLLAGTQTRLALLLSTAEPAPAPLPGSTLSSPLPITPAGSHRPSTVFHDLRPERPRVV